MEKLFKGMLVVALGISFCTGTLLAVNQETPVITWASPAAIIYGTALSATQLNARANVPGKFAYDPVAGIILPANVPNDLNVTFTPTDTGRYTTAQKTVSLTVNQATATVNITGLNRTYVGNPLPVTVTTVPANLIVNTTYNRNINAPTDIGIYAVVATVNDPNAKVTEKSATFVISKGVQTITFPPLPTNLIYEDGDYTLLARASSGLPVSYASSNPAVATIASGAIHIVGAGTSTITASQTGNAKWNAASSVGKALTIAKKIQKITFNALPDKECGDADFSPANASSGLAIAYTSANTSVATIVSGKIHIVGKGSAVITAMQPGNSNWNAAPSIQQTLIVNIGDQAITFSALPDKNYGAIDFAPGATASSGLAITYGSSNLNVATVVSGKIHIKGVGASNITATQLGNANWNAATLVTQTLTVNKGTPVITWANPAAIIYVTPLSATQLNARANVPGKFVYDPIIGVNLPVGLQTLNVTFTPTDTGLYSIVPKAVSLMVNKMTATVTITALSQAYTGALRPVTVSTLPAGLTVDTTYIGAPVAPVNAGSYAVVATINDSRYAGVKTGTLVVTKVNQTITFPTLPTNLIYGDGDYTLQASATSELPVSYASSNPAVATIAGDAIHIVGAGTSTITASQTGNANWNAASSVGKSLTIVKKIQKITFNALPAKECGDADFSPANASSGLAIAYTSANTSVATIVSGKIHIVGKGSAVITATQPGNSNWNAAPSAQQILTVNKGDQAITFNALPEKVYGAADFAPGATASSGLVITYASTNSAVATIVTGKVHITGAGTSIITAEQPGNANWNAAPQVTQTLKVAANAPTYPIADKVYTTLEKTLVPIPLPENVKPLLPCEVSEYAVNGYGLLNPEGAPAPFVRPDMQTNIVSPSVRDPLAATLLTFFSLSDTHLTDKESPAQCIYYGYEAGPLANISAYSAIILYTTHVLDAAIQTINVLNKRTPFDFGIDLGDAVNNNQYNELKWFIDVLDGQKITPSSGAHIGDKTIDYQKPYQAAGLDKSIKWYQAMGNHDPFWTGCLLADDYIKDTIVSSSVLNLGSASATYAALDLRGFYTGLVDGSTKYGDIIDVGPVEYYLNPPKVVADPDRRSLSIRDWMGEFLNSTTQPAGHGITQEMINDGLVRYSFHPRADIPLKVIVLDDIDKGGSANGTLDYQRLEWLVGELDAGERDGELMIVCAHIPVSPYAPPSQTTIATFPYYSLFATYSMISEETLLQKLWTYQNLIMWVSGHVHRNAITNQPPAAPTPTVPSPFSGDLTHAFWEVETPSLRDFPQQFRHFEIVRNSDNNISIFALDVDPAAKAPAEVGASAPAWTSRSYALASHQIYQIPAQQGPNVNANTGVYNAELVKQLSQRMKDKLALLFPAVSTFQINGNSSSTTSQTVTLNNTVSGITPTQYLASESPDFSAASWLPYSNAPAFILSKGAGTKTIYLKVIDGSGTESNVVSDSIVFQ